MEHHNFSSIYHTTKSKGSQLGHLPEEDGGQEPVHFQSNVGSPETIQASVKISEHLKQQ